MALKRKSPPKPGAGGKIGRYKPEVQPKTRKRRVDSGPGGRERQAPTKAGKAVSAGGRERQRTVRAKPQKNLGREGQGRNAASAQPSRAGSRASGRGR